MTVVKDLVELQSIVQEHKEGLKKFKNKMYIKFNNTDSKNKQAEILEEVDNIYTVMNFIFDFTVEKYNELENTIDDEELKNATMLQILEFRSEMMEMKRGN